MNRSKKITFGDKIFARVTRNGRTIYNFVSERVANMSDLISQLRKAIKDVSGLVMIHIRNYHQGWGEDRPLMLYSPKQPAFSVSTVHTSEPVMKQESQMFFPWETH